MTDLTIPPDVDERRAAELVQSHVELGDTVEIRNEERTEDHQLDVTGEVTGFEADYVELDGQSPENKGVRYDEIHTVSRIES
ncbi:hypothetical protein [Natrinema marinum]|uniref:hypothetical protein n=1 Tax=Natrinema marinum TaxID=2961598 RepID=UPI0020C8488A|nr:hypothetical protein [Natrinema marinum]